MNDRTRHVVITGVSRGLGAAMVAEFVERGHLVSGCSRSAATMQAMNDAYGEPHLFSECDVADAVSVDGWRDAVLRDKPPPDLLINNAALINQSKSLWEITAQHFSDVVDVNIKGVFHVIHSFLPAMLERQAGVIVNFSSGWGRSAAAEVAPYCATKWAVEGLTQSLAQELPHGIAAIPVNPGIIHTDMLESCFGDDARSYPSADKWAGRAVTFLLKLTPADSGQSLTVT